MSPEELRELDWTSKEEAEKIEIFKDCLHACLNGTEACAIRVRELLQLSLPMLMMTLKRVVSQIMHFTEGEAAKAKSTASATYSNWGAYVTSEVNSGAEWMSKVRNMMLYRDALIVTQILDCRERWTDSLLEVVTASEEMCCLMALDDVQKLAEATTSVTKKEHAHW